MTDFSPHILFVIFVTNIRYDLGIVFLAVQTRRVFPSLARSFSQKYPQAVPACIGSVLMRRSEIVSVNELWDENNDNPSCFWSWIHLSLTSLNSNVMRDHTYFQFIDPTDVANGLRASNDLFYLFYHLPQISQCLISSLLACFICAKFTFPPWRGDIWWDQEWTCDATLQIYFKTVEDNNIQGQAYLKWDHHIQWAFSCQWNRVPPNTMFTLILGVELQLAVPILGSWMHICSSSWVDTLDTGQPTQKNSPLNVPKTGVIRGQHLHWPLLSRILQKRAAEKWALEQPSTCQEC